MGSQAIAVRSSADVASLDELDRILLGVDEPQEVVDDPEQISREIIAQLLAASTDEELQNFGKATSWWERLGVPFLLLDFRWRVSDYEEGSPVYFLTRAVDTTTGEHVLLTTGAGNVLAQLSNLARRGQLGADDCVWMLVEAEKATKANFKPLHLEKVPVAASEAAA